VGQQNRRVADVHSIAHSAFKALGDGTHTLPTKADLQSTLGKSRRYGDHSPNRAMLNGGLASQGPIGEVFIVISPCHASDSWTDGSRRHE